MSLITELNEGAVFLERLADVLGHKLALEINELLNEVSAGAMGRAAVDDFVGTVKQDEIDLKQKQAQKVQKTMGDSGVGKMVDKGHVIIAKNPEDGGLVGYAVADVAGNGNIKTFWKDAKNPENRTRTFTNDEIQAKRTPVENNGRIVWGPKRKAK